MPDGSPTFEANTIAPPYMAYACTGATILTIVEGSHGQPRSSRRVLLDSSPLAEGLKYHISKCKEV